MSDARATTLDADALQRLRDLDPKGENRLLQRVLGAFETSAIRLSKQLDEARRVDDMDGVRMVAHTLKSSSASIGALALSRLCAGIESSVRTRGVEALPTMLDALELEFDNVLQALKPHLATSR